MSETYRQRLKRRAITMLVGGLLAYVGLGGVWADKFVAGFATMAIGALLMGWPILAEMQDDGQ